MPKSEGFRFEPDAAGVYEVTNSAEVGALLTQRANDARDQILKLAPRRRWSFYECRRGVKVRRARRVGRSIEAEVRVESSGWHLPEYGTAEVRATAPIRNGVRLAGIDFEEGR